MPDDTNGNATTRALPCANDVRLHQIEEDLTYLKKNDRKRELETSKLFEKFDTLISKISEIVVNSDKINTKMDESFNKIATKHEVFETKMSTMEKDFETKINTLENNSNKIIANGFWEVFKYIGLMAAGAVAIIIWKLIVN